MVVITRRTGLVAATWCLTAGGMARKPAAQEILSPKPDAPRVMHRLVPSDPPAPVSAQTFKDADGRNFTVADFAGKGLVVNLWATWCVPCVAEMPALDAMAQKLSAEGILVLPLSSDRGGASAVRKFYAAHSISHLGIWLDPDGEAAHGWGVRGLPTTLVIDRQGRERARLEGAAEWASEGSIAELRAVIG